jgi:hypothetical protein
MHHHHHLQHKNTPLQQKQLRQKPPSPPQHNPVVVAATCPQNHSPLYAVAVLTDSGCRIFANDPPHSLSHKNAADAVDYIAQHNHNVLAYHGKRLITALIAICSKFNDHIHIAALTTIAQHTSNIAPHIPLSAIFANNDKHGPAFSPYPQSFVHWITHPQKVIKGLINEIACLQYLHSTTTPHGKLARHSAGANVNTAFYSKWTKNHSHKIDYTALQLEEFTPVVSPHCPIPILWRLP